MHLTRRQLLLGSATTAALGAAAGLGIFANARLSHPKIAKIGFLSNVAAADSQFFPGFVEGLRKEGLIDGVNLRIEQRFADGKNELLPGYAAELIALGVQVLCATGGTVPPIAARATDRIPIVVVGGDPVGQGLADSIVRPGRNVTGVTQLAAALDAKVLEALVAIAPNATRLAWFANFAVGAPATRTAFMESTQKLHLDVLALDIQQRSDLEPAFQRASDWGSDIMYAANVVPLNVPRPLLAQLALQWRIPSGSAAREWVETGSLIAYNTPGRFVGQRAAWYVARILEGANPAELPIDNPMVFDVVVNRTTVAYLGLTIPPHVATQITDWID